MQQDAFEVLFCDLCGTSVPLADLERGVALRHQGKTIGQCCLLVLRQGESPLANPGAPSAAERRAEGGATAALLDVRRDGNGGRLLPVAIFLLAAIAAVAIFLDQRITGLDTSLRGNHDQLAQAQRSDIKDLGVAMDAVARQKDVDSLIERIAGLDRAVTLSREQAREHADAGRRATEAQQQEVRKVAAAAVDYRPSLDDIRLQLQRLAASLGDLRVPAGVAPSVPVEAVGAQPPLISTPEVPGLPDPLAAQVRKLGDKDAAVQIEAVDALAESKNPLVLPHLLPMARDADVYVRRLTVEALRDFRSVEAVEQLLQSLADTEVNVADTAWSSLKKLTGQKLPFDAASASKEAKLRAQQKWQEWWEKNKATFSS